MSKHVALFFICSLLLVSCKDNKSTTINDENQNVEINDSISIESVTNEIRNNPRNPDLFLKRAALYVNSMDLENALTDTKIALQLDSLRPDIYLKIADYNLILGKSEDAKDVLVKGVQLLPNEIEIRLKLGYIFYYVQMYIDAMKEINYIEAHNLQNTETFYLKALIFDDMEMYSEAITALRKAIEYDNSNWKAYNLIGVLYGSIDDKLAVEYFKTAKTLFPDNIEVRYNAGVIFQKFGLYEEATDEYKYVISTDPTNTASYYNLGIVYVDTKNYLEAINNFTKAIETDSLSYRAYYNRGFAYEQLKRYKMAETDYRKSLEILPNFDLAVEGLNDVIEKISN